MTTIFLNPDSWLPRRPTGNVEASQFLDMVEGEVLDRITAASAGGPVTVVWDTGVIGLAAVSSADEDVKTKIADTLLSSRAAIQRAARKRCDTPSPQSEDMSTTPHAIGGAPPLRIALETEHGKLWQGDCLELLAQTPDDSVDCVFADPPFNLGKDYGKGISDALRDADYLDWCAAWTKECARVVKPGGSLWLYNLPKWNIELGHMLNEYGLMFRHWVAIHMTTVMPIQGRLYPSHYSLLYYSKGKPSHFVRPRVPIATCRHCGGDIKDYGGHKNKMNPEGVNVSDVWTDIPPVRHSTTKHRGANALSEKLLERVLSISTAEGDVVFDPFGGSGTTYAVAERMHRRWLGSELGDVEPIIARLSGTEKVDGYMPLKGDGGKGVMKRQAKKAITAEPDRLFPS